MSTFNTGHKSFPHIQSKGTRNTTKVNLIEDDIFCCVQLFHLPQRVTSFKSTLAHSIVWEKSYNPTCMQHQQQYEYQGGYQQEQEYYDEQQYYHDQQHEPGSDDYNNQMLLQEMQMMGIDPSDPEGVQFFLQYLQQREEQERQQADRPDEHYMTIAQNGKYKYLCNINLGLGISNWIKGHNSPRNFERHFCSTLLFPCGI